jgi:hypothetical protein
MTIDWRNAFLRLLVIALMSIAVIVTYLISYNLSGYLINLFNIPTTSVKGWSFLLGLLAALIVLRWVDNNSLHIYQWIKGKLF